MEIGDEWIAVNGVDASTGKPLADPISVEDFANLVLRLYSPEEREADRKPERGPEPELLYDDVVPDEPPSAGWGLIMHKDDESLYKTLLKDLISHRNGRIIVYDGEPAMRWVKDNDARSKDPDIFPGYLLIAGSPDKVPFDLQFLLATLPEKAVGRVDFDEDADYTRYAQNVVHRETGKTSRPARRAIVFAPNHPDDPAKFEPKGCDELARPLLRDFVSGDADSDRSYLFSVKLNFIAELDKGQISTDLREQFPTDEPLSSHALVEVTEIGCKWTIIDAGKRYLVKNENHTLKVYNRAEFVDLTGVSATKSNLLQALSADDAGGFPALLFSVSHGLACKSTDSDFKLLQGSLLCQDIVHPVTKKERTGVITALDVDEGSFRLPGGIHFMFACYGAGTRAHSDYTRYLGSFPKQSNLVATISASQASRDFTASLPKALLARGEALAVVAHLDLIWTLGFSSQVNGRTRMEPYGLTTSRLLSGKPVGRAVRDFPERYSFFSNGLLDQIEKKQPAFAKEMANSWMCRNDAKNYVVLGDPAVRIQFD